MDTALPLITVTDGHFQVNEETASLLSQIEEPIAVLCIAGLYRTGKSFILNQLLGRLDGFEISPSVKPCTKGLWIWGKPIPLSNQHGQNFRLLLVDTEGIGSFGASETHDHQIFSLGLLLSSFFIYNSLGSIDETAISRLGVVTELSRHVTTRAKRRQDDFSELANFFPTFLWLVRDFTLELSSDRMTSRDYLELVLNTSDSNDLSKHNIKNMLKSYFPDRDCFTLIRPVVEEKRLSNISSTLDLRQDFMEQVDLFKKKIFNSVQPKVINGNVLNGRTLCNAYSQAMTDGGIVIETCWDNVVVTECETAFAKASKFYQSSTERMIEERGIIDLDIYEIFHREKEEQAMQLFIDASVSDGKVIHYQNKLKKLITDHYNNTREVLKQTSNKLCNRIIEESITDLNEKMPDLESFQQFEAQFNTILSNYSSKAKGSERSSVLLHALLRHYFPKAKILHQTLTKKSSDTHRADMKKLQETHQQEINSLNRRNASHIDSLKSQLSQMTQSYEDMKHHFFDLKEQKTRAEEQIHAETMKCESLQVELSTLKRSYEILEQHRNEDQSLLQESNSNIQHLEQKIDDAKSQLLNLEETLNQTSDLLGSVQQEKQSLLQNAHRSEEEMNTMKSELLDAQSQLRKVQREVTNKNAIIRSYERAMALEKEKATESEDRLRLSLKEKAHLLSSDRAQELERQVEQLNVTNRRILELNKTVMEENKQLKEQIIKLGGSVSVKSPGASSTRSEAFSPNSIPEREVMMDEVDDEEDFLSRKKLSHSSPASPRYPPTTATGTRKRTPSSSLVLNGGGNLESNSSSSSSGAKSKTTTRRSSDSFVSPDSLLKTQDNIFTQRTPPSSLNTSKAVSKGRSPSPIPHSRPINAKLPAYHEFEKVLARSKTPYTPNSITTTSDPVVRKSENLVESSSPSLSPIGE